jgi:hypothetical protein
MSAGVDPPVEFLTGELNLIKIGKKYNQKFRG